MRPDAKNVPSDRSAETRDRILDAALREFSASGFAGARMDRIAAAASVNKALIYYYFDSKENLYAAVLEMITAKIRDRSMAVFLRDVTPGERLLRTALDHFDRILISRRVPKPDAAGNDAYRQRGIGRNAHSREKGIRASPRYVSSHGAGGHFVRRIDRRRLDANSSGNTGCQRFLFSRRPGLAATRAVRSFCARSARGPATIAVVEFLGQAVFIDRRHGAELAARVLADTPMPELPADRQIFGRTNERKK